MTEEEQDLSPDELGKLPRIERVRYVIKRFGPTQEKFAASVKLDRTVVNKLANGARVVPAYARRFSEISGYDAALFQSPRTAAEAEREAEQTWIVQFQELRQEVAALGARVEDLARKVG